MLTCILFVIGSTNFVTPGCMQATGIVTPNEIVYVKQVPRRYKRSVIPYYRRVVKFDDVMEFRNYRHWMRFDHHRSRAMKHSNRRMYKGLFRWIQKSNQKRYRFHSRLRRLGLR